MGSRRSVVVAGALLLALSACSAGEEPVGKSPETPGAREDVPSALEDMRHPAFPDPLIDPDKIIAGGPPPDGIPPIDAPKFRPARDVDWLADEEPVLSLTLNGETRAYPLQVMTWHEIVNDTVADVPVAVTYCPLCNSGVAFERRAAGRLLDFGTSGRLYADNLVMYDRQTESLWPQLTGQAAVGVLTGTQLKAIPMGAVGWDDFLAGHPDAMVLTRDTGHDRPYGQNPYTGYDDPSGEPLFDLPGPEDARLPVKERVVGIRVGGDSLALRRSWIADQGVVSVTVAGSELVVWHRAGQLSALDQRDIAYSQDIGTIGVFEPRVGNKLLTFEPVSTGFRDAVTGSTGNVQGRAVAGPLRGEQLAPRAHLDTFWFVWVAFEPDTRLLP